MASDRPPSGSSPIAAEDIRAHVERIRNSSTFAKSDRLGRFLAFVVEETLAGRAETLKEQVIASALYSHDSGSDPVVRVDARRLRDKLREYYSEFPGDSIEITLPKGSYVPRFERRVESKMVEESLERRPARHSLRNWIVLAVVVSIAATMAFFTLRPFAKRQVEFTPIPLTSYPGLEDSPSLSPDGNFVAFAWTGEGGGPRHIYIKAVTGDSIRQLTHGITGENSPVWSPDGQNIAFVRNPRGVYAISVLGGSEQLISDVGTYAAWTADSKALLVRTPGPSGPNGVVQVSLATKENRQITQAPVGDGEWRFEVSPDGESLAFCRYGRSGVADLYLVPMKGGNPKRITNWSSSLTGVAWTPDGRELVYSVRESTGARLWRIASNVSSPGKGDRIAGTGAGASHPSISRPAHGQPVRLAYDLTITDVGLRVVDLTKSKGGEFASIERVADSSRGEQPGRWSPDAEQLAFVSDRDGDMAIWICNRDGSGLQKLALQNGTVSWSPDRKSIAFDSVDDGNTEVYVIPTSGGQARRLTSDPGIDGTPEWSRDGRWIYFTSTRADQRAQLWRMPADGGAPTQITTRGGFRPRESPDGKFLYYVDRLPGGMQGRGRLMRVPAQGGEEVQILEDVGGWTWDATDAGIVFLSSTQTSDAVDLVRYEDHKTIRLGRLPFRPSRVAVGWAVSREGRWLLTNQIDRFDSDLMVIHNFR